MKKLNRDLVPPFGRIGAAALSISIVGWALPAHAQLNIVMSGGTTVSQGQVHNQPLIDFIENNFSNSGPGSVTYGDFSNYATNQATIEGADIFMVARALSSPAYDNLANSASFNALAKPVVCFTSFVSRTNGNRWSWHSGDILAGVPTVFDETTVTAAGVTPLGLAEGDYDLLLDSNSLSGAGVGTVGGGEILASVGGNILAAAWDTGELSAGGATFGGPRLLWNISEISGADHTAVLPNISGRVALAKALAQSTPLLPIDSDNDGLFDFYEQYIIDSNPDDSIVGLADVAGPNDAPATTNIDGDGATDAEEFANGTDPTVPSASSALTVLISGTNQTNDQAIVDFIEDNFEDVNVAYGDFSNYAANSTTIEGADLFIVGRSLVSTAYDNATNSASFNALAKPVVCFTSYVARTSGNRWSWHGGPEVFGAPYFGTETTVTSSGTTAFGVSEGTYDWVPDLGGNQFNAAGGGSVGDGEVLATIGGNILAARWNAGDLSGDGVTTFGGERLLYNLHQVGAATVMPTGAGGWALIQAMEAYTPLTKLASLDTDDDGLPDSYEMQIIDFDAGDAVAGLADVHGPNDATTTDFDNDGLSDADEFFNGTDFANSDSDFDGIDDGDEVSGSRNPYDEFGVFVGVGNGGAPTNPLDDDSDNDGLRDEEEVEAGADGFVTNPNSNDTDGDFLLDDWEIANNLDPTDETGDNGDFGDPDEDDLDNFSEQNAGTNPQVGDTDGDGLNDGPELFGTDNDLITHGFGATDPLVQDTDGDGIWDGEEVVAGVDGFVTNPNMRDTDGDTFSDSFEIARNSDPTNGSATPAGFTTVTASVGGTTVAGATSDGTTGVLFTTASFDMLGGNAVALLVTTEMPGGVTPPITATFAGQPMAEAPAVFDEEAGGVQASRIFYLIDPATTVGAFEVTTTPGLTNIALAYSQLALSDVQGVAAVVGVTSGLDAPAAPLDVNYTTVEENGFVLTAAVNNDFNNTRQMSVASGNPGTDLLGHTLVGTSGHFHTYGRVSPAGSYTDSYLGQFDRTAIVSVVFGVGPADLVITSVTRDASGDVTIDFLGAADTSYQVTKSADLETAFGPLAAPLNPTTDGSGAGQVTVPASEFGGAAKYFLRIEE